MLKNIVLFIFLLVYSACSLLSRDESPSVAQFDPSLCRLAIEKRLCLVAPRDDEALGKPAACLNNSEKIKLISKELQAQYDQMPEPFQKVFCTLSNIFIEQGEFQGAYAFETRDDSRKITGGLMGIGLSKFSSSETLAANFQRLNAVPFDLASADKKSSELFSTTAPSIPGINTMIFSYLFHEIAHLLDFYNGVNPFPKECSLDSEPQKMRKECFVTKGTWSSLSWINQAESIFDNSNFPDRKRLFVLFDPAGPKIPQAEGEKVMASLFQHSTFVSTLGSIQPFDDWAESITYYVIMKKTNQPIVIKMRSGKEYNLMEKMNSEQFKAKKKYMDEFLVRKDLNYPGWKLN